MLHSVCYSGCCHFKSVTSSHTAPAHDIFQHISRRVGVGRLRHFSPLPSYFAADFLKLLDTCLCLTDWQEANALKCVSLCKLLWSGAAWPSLFNQDFLPPPPSSSGASLILVSSQFLLLMNQCVCSTFSMCFKLHLTVASSSNIYCLHVRIPFKLKNRLL